MQHTEPTPKAKVVPQQSKLTPQSKTDRERFERSRKALYEYWKLK